VFARNITFGIQVGGVILKPKGGVLARIAVLLRSNTHR